MFFNRFDDTGDVIDTSGIENNTIIAKVDDGSAYNDLVDEVHVYMGIGGGFLTDCEYKNGGFELKLPANVSSSRLVYIFRYYEGCVISNPYAQLNSIQLSAFKNGEFVGIFHYFNETSTKFTRALHYYVDADKMAIAFKFFFYARVLLHIMEKL
ncbi:MAG: hypothetical protein FWH18_04175 [Marinilabiliaceae bacterium]|nr:hypothetical protein [Marinilabiliaceae bacterium]